MKKLIFYTVSLFLVLINLSGCVSIVSFSQSNVTAKKARTVAAEDSGVGYLNLTVPELSIHEKLAQTCPAGNLTNVETTLSKRDLILIQDYVLEAKASCQDSVDLKK